MRHLTSTLAHCSILLHLLRERLRKRWNKQRDSHCTRPLWRMTRRVPRSTVAPCLTARTLSLQCHACAPHDLLETQLHASALHFSSMPHASPPSSPPFSAISSIPLSLSPRFSPGTAFCPATLNARKAWRQQAKDECCTAAGRHAGKEGGMSLVRKLALPEQFQSGNTSDNTPFALLLWIRALWIHSCFFRQIRGRRKKHQKHLFSAISHFYACTIVPPA